MKNIEGLNGLRGVAVVMVIIAHLGGPFPLGGLIGVDIFFTLSGFLITAITLTEFKNTGNISLPKFYARRALRLFPAFFVFLLCLIIFVSVFMPSRLEEVKTETLYSLGYAVNFSKAYGWYDIQWLWHVWSLSLEEQFYLIWPMVFWLTLAFFRPKDNGFRLILILVIFSIAWRIFLTWNGATTSRLYHGLDTRNDTILMGSALGVLYINGFSFNARNFFDKWRIHLILGASLILLGLFFLVDSGRPEFYLYEIPIIGLCTCILVFEVSQSPKGKLSQVLAWKPLAWVGTLSYGIYLWHYTIFRLLSNVNPSSWFILFVGVPLALGVASVSYYFLEKPLMGLRYRFKVEMEPRWVFMGPKIGVGRA